MDGRQIVEQLEHWASFFEGEDYEGLTVVADLRRAAEYIGARAEKDAVVHHDMCAVNSACNCGAGWYAREGL